MRKFSRYVLLAGVVLIACSCNRAIVTPTPPEPVSNAVLYFAGSGDLNSIAPVGHIFKYDVNNRVLDSFAVPEMDPLKGVQIELMPDGTKLYFSEVPDGPPKIIDLTSRQVVDTLLFPVDQMDLSSNGKWLALLNNGTVFILRTEDNQVVFERRMVTAYSGSFLADNSWFYCIMTGQGSTSPLVKVFRIRTSDWLVDSILVPVIRYPSRLVVIDTQHFAFYGAISVPSGESDEVAIYDNSLNSVTYRHQFSPGAGDLLYNFSNKELYFTAPGTFADVLPGGSYWLFVISNPVTSPKLDSFSVSVAIPRTPIQPSKLVLSASANKLAVRQRGDNKLVVCSVTGRSVDTLLITSSQIRGADFVETF